MPKKVPAAATASQPKVYVGTAADIRPDTKVLWQPYPGPQTQILLAQEDEIFGGGAKAGGKTAAGIAWLLTGNPYDVKPADKKLPADISYINHPHYRALVLRKNVVDLADWIDKADRIYRVLGGVYRERPLSLFEFPSGAKIILGHLDDVDAYQKYQGQEFHRLLLEEATLVPDLKSYKMVRSCLRSVYPELRVQTLLTANPGGPGHGWCRDRFVKPKDANGNIIPPNTRIIDQDTGETRIYIPARLKDNPALLADPKYVAKLMDLPDAERRAMLDGDWDALSGVFFTDFRPNGPLVGEEKYNAQHVIPSRELHPWLNRFIGMDWGYSHEGAAYWGCDNDDGRIHIYRERVAAGRGAKEWGAEIALASLPDLKGLDSGVMTLHLSPDAWDKRNDTRALADQIGEGIAFVLGPQSSLILRDDDIGPVSEFMARMEDQRRFGIIIRKAANQRIAGASYIRSLLRWKPLTSVEVHKFDQDLFLRLLHADSSRAMQYRDACARQERPEALPGLLIHGCCPQLVEAIASRMRDETNPEDVMKVKSDPGDNNYDAFRYAVFSHSKENVRSPLRVQMAERLAAVAAARGGGPLEGNTMIWCARKMEEDFAADSSAGVPMNIPRSSGRRAKRASRA